MGSKCRKIIIFIHYHLHTSFPQDPLMATASNKAAACITLRHGSFLQVKCRTRWKTIAFCLLQQRTPFSKFMKRQMLSLFNILLLLPRLFLPTNKISLFSHPNLLVFLKAYAALKKWCSNLAFLLGTGREIAVGLKGIVCFKIKAAVSTV